LRATYKLLGTEDRGGSKAYKIQEIPLAPHAKWYYSRIVTWIAVDSSLPIERDFYDPSNTLWKIERFEQASDVDGVSTPFRERIVSSRESRTILIVVDGSAASRRALAYVARIVGRRRGFRLCLIYLLPPLPPRLLESRGTEDPKAEEQLSAQLKVKQRRWIST